jgi:site-specific DNA recombinase
VSRNGRSTATSNHGESYYRCRYGAEHAASAQLPHPKTVYLREADLLPQLDGWLASIFDPGHVDHTCRALAEESDVSEHHEIEVGRLEGAVKDCRTRLDRYRAALDAGTDPHLVAGWIDEVRREQADAERRLAELRHVPDRLDAAEIRAAVEHIGGLVPILRAGAPADRAAFYEAVGLRGDYNPHERTVTVEARVRMDRVGGGT